jgi:hypothetical protein
MNLAARNLVALDGAFLRVKARMSATKALATSGGSSIGLVGMRGGYARKRRIANLIGVAPSSSGEAWGPISTRLDGGEETRVGS